MREGCAVHAYVLMTNHVHLLMTSPLFPHGMSGSCQRTRCTIRRPLSWNDEMNRGGSQRRLPMLRSTRLFAAVAAAFGIEGSVAAAVTSCADDGGFDTLRHAVMVANDGDTIDLSALTCSKITLGSALATSLDNLTISGPGADKLTIDGNQAGRVFAHTPTGTGTFTISNVTVANGKFTASQAYGGCILSLGDVVLRNAVVTSCTALGQTVAFGGGIVAAHKITAFSSAISGNVANAQSGTTGTTNATGGGAAVGATTSGGIYLYGSLISGNTAESPLGRVYGGGVATYHLVAKYSTITGNHALSAGTNNDVGVGGGVDMSADSEILNCTLDHNVADGGGAIDVRGAAGYTAAIVQTTISSNTANIGAGGLLANGAVLLLNSTLAFNSANGYSHGGGILAGAVTLSATSTIIADNSPSDIDVLSTPLTVGGDHDLVKVAGPNVSFQHQPISVDPDLGPLAYNGGYTRTHALSSGSIAIGAGANPESLANDQRGPPYQRVVGASADIGAYEFDADRVFGNDFDDGPLFSGG